MGRRIRGAGDEEKLELKMTSMIDVVFLLLIFFIVTLQIPAEEAMIEAKLPKATAEGEEAVEEEARMEFEDIVLQLRISNGVVQRFINDQPMSGLVAMLSKLGTFGKLNPEGRVIIDCADDVPYKELVTAINASQIAGLSISFANIH